MFVPLDIKQRVIDVIQMGIAKAEAAYGIKIQMPTLTYLLRGTTGGTAHYGTWTINFNSQLLMENIEAYMARTVLHELGHLVCDKVYPEAHRPAVVYSGNGFRRAKREVHGPRWQSVMIVLGGPTTRCHSYDVSNVSTKRKTVGWSCVRCVKTYQLGPKHHNKLTLNCTAYKCKCGGVLKLATGAAPVQAVTPVKIVTPTSVQVLTGSKIDVCSSLYAKYVANGYMVERKMMINLFMTHAHCTNAGAATYYATLKKRFESA